jgi:hypothetical protein
LALDGNLPSALQSGRDQLFGQQTVAVGDDAWLTQIEQAAAWQPPAASSDALATPVVPLQEALRFDVQPEWIVSRWPRVATVVGELDWAGMRVPLITGYEPRDTVGSLTYYFDSQRRLRRISLEGFAGDERELASIAMQNFGLRPEPTLGAGLFAYRWNGEPLSVLSVQFAPIVTAETPQIRRRVMLEINRPEPGWRLSPQMQAIVSPAGMPRL